MVEGMPFSFEFLRGALAMLGAGCAFLLGRSAAGYRRGWVRKSTVWSWAIRTAVCALALTYRYALDAVDIAAWSLAAAAAAAGWWHGSRPRKDNEDLTHVIFPDGQ
jgi:hypothetical protein